MAPRKQPKGNVQAITQAQQMSQAGREARYVNRMTAAGSGKSPAELVAEFRAKTAPRASPAQMAAGMDQILSDVRKGKPRVGSAEAKALLKEGVVTRADIKAAKTWTEVERLAAQGRTAMSRDRGLLSGGADDIAARLKGLKKAGLQAVAKEVGASVGPRATVSELRGAIQKSIVADGRTAAKHALAGQIKPWGGAIDYSRVSTASGQGAASQAQKIASAVDKVAAPVGQGAKGAAKTLAKGAGRAALKALTPIAAVMAAATMFRSSAQAGENTAVSAVKAVAAGADSVLTFGALTAVASDPKVQAEVDKQRAQPRGARGSAPAVTAPQKSGVDRAISAILGGGSLGLAKIMMSEARGSGVGLIAKTGLRTGAVVSGVIGVSMVVDAVTGGAKADDASASQPPPDHRAGLAEVTGGLKINAANLNPAERVRDLVSLSADKGAYIHGIAAGQKARADISAARTEMARIAAKRSVGDMRQTNAPIMPSAGASPKGGRGGRTAAQKPRSDGFAEAYTRTQNGRTVQVKGYHIEPRR